MASGGFSFFRPVAPPRELFICVVTRLVEVGFPLFFFSPNFSAKENKHGIFLSFQILKWYFSSCRCGAFLSHCANSYPVNPHTASMAPWCQINLAFFSNAIKAELFSFWLVMWQMHFCSLSSKSHESPASKKTPLGTLWIKPPQAQFNTMQLLAVLAVEWRWNARTSKMLLRFHWHAFVNSCGFNYQYALITNSPSSVPLTGWRS